MNCLSNKYLKYKETNVMKKATKIKDTTTPAKTTTVLPMNPTTNTLSFWDSVHFKSLAVQSSVTMFNAPQFAAQVNPAAILGLADAFYKYAVGGIMVQAKDIPNMSPDEAKALLESKTHSPKFG